MVLTGVTLCHCSNRRIPAGFTGIIGWLAPFTFVFFSSWHPSSFPHGILYTVVVFWTVYGNLFGGMAQGGGGYLPNDCALSWR